MFRGTAIATASILAFLAMTLLLGACGGGRPEVTVAAAADLRPAFEELQPAFERSCGCHVVFSFGSSGQLASQIEQGMPADAFFSANVTYVDDLDGKGITLADTKQDYAIGHIVLATARSGTPIGDLVDLRDGGIRKISIANPDHAPYGAAAKQAMQAAGVWDDVKDKLVLAENVSQATQYVETGDAQAGIVPLSLAIGRDDLRYVMIDPSLYAPLRQAAAVVARARHADLARAFIRFVTEADGRAVMDRYGFEPPSQEGG